MKHKKLLAVVLAFVMLFCCASISASAAVPSNVESPSVSPRYINFSSVWADIYKTSWGYYDVSGGAAAYSNDITVEVTVYVEGLFNGLGWDRYDYWEVTGSGTAIANAAGSRTLSESGSYRAYTVAEAYRDGQLIETVTAYSPTVLVLP